MFFLLFDIFRCKMYWRFFRRGRSINMSHPYKTRAGGATVTVFVPYDCANHCPFCINKKEYADCSGFSLEAILRSIRIMDSITPACDLDRKSVV